MVTELEGVAVSVQEATALKLIAGECSESEVVSYKEDANCTPSPHPSREDAQGWKQALARFSQFREGRQVLRGTPHHLFPLWSIKLEAKGRTFQPFSSELWGLHGNLPWRGKSRTWTGSC